MKPKSLTYPAIVSGEMSNPNVLKSETTEMLAKEAFVLRGVLRRNVAAPSTRTASPTSMSSSARRRTQ